MNAAFIRIGLTGCDRGSRYFLPRGDFSEALSARREKRMPEYRDR